LQPQDIYNRTHRKLNEPKTLQQAYDITKKITPEQKYYSALNLLEQWNKEYRKPDNPPPNQLPIFSAKLKIDLEKQKYCLAKISEILETVYADIKGTAFYKSLQKNLIEASKRFLEISHGNPNQHTVKNFEKQLDELSSQLSSLERQKIKEFALSSIKDDFVTNLNSSKLIATSNKPTIFFKLAEKATFLPKLCENSNGLDLPFQEEINLEPHELRKVSLSIQIQLPANHFALLLNKSSASVL